MKSVLKQSAIKLYNTYENVLFYSSIMVAVKPLHLYTEHRRHKYINQLFFWDWYAQNGMARLFWKGIQTLFMKEAFQLNSRMDCYCSKLAKLYGVPQRHSIIAMKCLAFTEKSILVWSTFMNLSNFSFVLGQLVILMWHASSWINHKF